MRDRPPSSQVRGAKARQMAADLTPGSCTDQAPTIVVCVDGSECSLRAVSYAAGLARRQGAELVAVYLRRGPSGFAYLANTPGAYAAVMEAERSTEQRSRDEIAGECAVAGVECTVIVQTGSNVQAVIDIAQARQAHALIVGSRPGLMARLLPRLMPSASGSLAARAGRPVVLVP